MVHATHISVLFTVVFLLLNSCMAWGREPLNAEEVTERLLQYTQDRMQPDSRGMYLTRDLNRAMEKRLKTIDDPKLRKAVRRLFPPVGTPGRYRTSLRHAQWFAIRAKTYDIDPVPCLTEHVDKSSNDGLAALCLVQYASLMESPEMLVLDDGRFIRPLVLSYGEPDVVRPMIENYLATSEFYKNANVLLPLLAVIGDEGSLAAFYKFRERAGNAARSYERYLKVFEDRLAVLDKLSDDDAREEWNRNELLYYQVLNDSPYRFKKVHTTRKTQALLGARYYGPQFSSTFEYLGTTGRIQTLLGARYHGAEFSPDFLRSKLPHPGAILFLGIQGERDAIPDLKKLTENPTAVGNYLNGDSKIIGMTAWWAIQNIEDDVIPVNYERSRQLERDKKWYEMQTRQLKRRVDKSHPDQR